MSTDSVLRQSMKILLGYSDLFGKTCSLDELIGLLKQYPLEQWLNFLSRIQITIAGDRFGDMEAQRNVVKGMFSALVCESLTRWCDENKDRAKNAFVVSERQVSVLQELAIIHAPENLEGKAFEQDQDFSVLTDALLIVTDFLHNSSPVGPNDLIAITAHTQVVLNDTPSWRSFPRAIQFYQIGKDTKSPEVIEYDELFTEASGRSIQDYVMGGICCGMQDEMRTNEEICSGWYAIRQPCNCKNPLEAEVVEAFLSLRAGTVEQIRAEILVQEADLIPRDFNLIALSRFPVVQLNNGSYFILNLSALTRSLFDGPRHVVMTSAVGRSESERRRVGGAYGGLFQRYALSILMELFGDRVVVIPESTYPGHADCLMFFKDVVVVAEIKGEHFAARTHFKYMSGSERISEIKKTGLGKSAGQIAKTITVLRNYEFAASLAVPCRDWTVTPIVPLIITDEKFPMFPLIWEGLYSEIERPLVELSGGQGTVSRMRLMNMEELELFQDVQERLDFGSLLYQWSSDPKTYDFSPKNFLLAHDYVIGHRNRVEDLKFACRALAERLGLDSSEIKIPHSV